MSKQSSRRRISFGLLLGALALLFRPFKSWGFVSTRMRRQKARPTLWLPLRTNINNSGDLSFTTTSNNITFTTVGSYPAAYLDGSTGASANSVNVTNNETALNLGTGDFTFEVWVYPISVASTPYLFDYRPLSNQTANFPALRIQPTGRIALQRIVAGAASILFTSTGSVTLNAWNHVAFVRSSGTMTIYLNGTADGTNSTAQTFSVNSGSQRPLFGTSSWSASPTSTLNGYMYDVKIWVGKAIYTANFTPSP